MTRFRAAAIHLSISAAVAASVLAIMLMLWYPGAYFKLMGGGKLLFILAGVDVCLGPLLTLIVFKSGKKGLAFDLTAIAFLQVVAMSYGVSIMLMARPVFTVFSSGEFNVVASKDLDADNLANAARPEWRKLSLTGPVLVAANISRDPGMVMGAMIARMTGQQPALAAPSFFEPYQDARKKVLDAARPLAKLRAAASGNPAAIDAFLKARGRGEEQFAYVPLHGRNMAMAAIVDAKTGDFIDILDATP